MPQYKSHYGMSLILLAALAVGSLHAAQTLTWNGSSSSNWSVGANWTPNAVPANGDSLILANGTNNPQNLDITGLSIVTLTINDTNAGNYTINGAQLTLTGGITVAPAAGNPTLVFPIAMTGAQTWSIGAGRTLAYSGVLSGSGALTLTSTGTLTLSNSTNSFTGDTAIGAGTLRVGAANSLGNNAAYTVTGTLDLNGNSALIGSLAGAGTITLGSTAGTVLTFGGNNANTTYSGTISGTGGITKNGTGTFTLTSALTYNGPTVVNGGTFRLLTIAPGPVPAGAAAYYSFDNASGTSVPNLGSLGSAKDGTTMNSTAVNASMITADGVGKIGKALNIAQRGDWMSIAPGSGSGVSLAGDWTTAAWFNALWSDATIYRTLFRGFGNDHQALINPAGTTGGFLGTYSNGANTFYSCGYKPDGSAGGPNVTTGWHHICSVGTGTAPSAITTLYIDGVQVGTTPFKSIADVGAIGNVPNAANASGQPWGSFIDEVYIYQRALTPAEVTTLFSSGSGNANLPANTAVSITNNATLNMGPNAATFSTLSSTAGSSLVLNGPLTFGDATPTTFAGTVAGSGSMTKVGSAIFTVTGTLGTGTAFNLNGGTLNLADVSQNVGSLASASGTQVTLGSNAATVLTMGANNGSTTFAGVISGAGNITKAGAGTMVLSAPQVYGGNTTVSGGTLKAAASTNPVAYYSFDTVSGKVVNNQGSFGSAKNATMFNTASVTSGGGGKFGEALAINAYNDWLGIALNNSEGIDTTNIDWTATAWVRSLYTNADWRTLFRSFPVTGEHQLLIEKAATRMGVYDGSTNPNVVIPTLPNNYRIDGTAPAPGNINIDDNQWHHIASVGSGTTTAIYVDGVLVGTCARKSTQDICAIGNVNNAVIVGGQPFSQRIDDVCIYQRALSQAEIAALISGPPSMSAPVANILPVTTNVTLNSPGILDLSSGAQLLRSLAGNAGSGLVFHGSLTVGDATNAASTYSGTASGMGSFFKSGTGTLTIGGVWSTVGNTNVNAGTLAVTGTGRLSLDSALTINGGIVNTSAASVAQTVGSLAGASGAALTLGASSFTAGQNNTSTLFSGTITGTGTFGKSGTGTLTVATGFNAVAVFTLNAGSVIVQATPFTGTPVVTMLANTSLELPNTFSPTFNSLTGGANARLILGSAASTLTVGGNNASTTFGGVISGNTSLVKNGAGTFTLAGAQTYLGSTTVNTGILRLLGTPFDPVAYYSFDSLTGGSVPNLGAAGFAKNGVLNGSAAITSGNGGIRGEALSLPAAGNAFMSIPLTGVKGIDLATSTAGWTASAWFNGLHPIALQRTLFASNTPNDCQAAVQGLGYVLGVVRTDGFYAGAQSATPFGTANGFDMQAYTTGWHHLTAVGIGTAAQTALYLDGVLVGTSQVKSVSDIFSIGSNKTGTQPFAQKIDEVYIFQRALTAEEVSLHYLDSTQGGVNILPATTALTLNGTSALEMGSGSQELATLVGGATTQFRLNGGRLIVGGTNASFAYAGTINGSGGRLVKNGSGTMTLTGVNTYTGGTNVNAGVMQGSATGVQGDILNNASVIFDEPGTNTYAGIMSGPGSLTKINSGTLVMTGNNTYTGTTIINSGILRIQVGNPLPAIYYSFDNVNTEVVNEGTLGIAKNGIFNNLLTTAPGGRVGNALNFPLSNNGWLGIKLSTINGLQKGAELGANSYTIACWFNGLVASTANYRTFFRGSPQTAPNDGDHQGLIRIGTNEFGFFGNAAGGAFRVSSNPPPPTGGIGFDMSPFATGWHHMAIVGNQPSNTSDYYVDGVYRGTADRKTNSDLYSIGNIAGAGTGANQPFCRMMDELYVYNRALSAGDINALFTLSPLPPASVLPSTTPVVINGGTLDVNNCIQTIGSLSGAAGTSVTLGSGVLTTGGLNTSTAFAGVISGTGGIAKAGTGNFTLNGQNTYSGATTVGAGILEVANVAGSATGTSVVTATTGGTFAGTGAVTSNVNTTATGIIAVGPTLAPGFGTTTTGPLSLAGNIVFQLTTPDNGVPGVGGDDEYVVNGNLTLGGSLTVPGAGLARGRYHLFTYTGTLSGTFATYNLPDGYAGQLVSGGGSVDLFLNHRPVLAPISNATLNEGGSLSFTASATDADATDVLSYSLAGTPPAGASIDPVSGAFTWTTVDGPNQTGPITVRVTDNGPGAFFAEQTFTVTVNNVAPTAAISGTGSANEGVPYTLNLASSDPGQDTISQWVINWGDGNIQTVNGNPSSVTHSYADGPANFVVTATAQDEDGTYAANAPHSVSVSNVTPTGTLVNNVGGNTTEGTPSATVTMQSPTDPSPVDQASLHFAFDWDNNGNFDVGDGTYVGSVVSNVTTIPTALLDDGPRTLTIRARVIDKENTFSEYTTSIVISNVAPTANLGNLPPVNEGGTAPVLVGGQFDPSVTDTNAGFRYSYDFNYNLVTPQFDLGGNSYATASFSFNPPIPPSQLPDGPATQTVLARIWDKDNGFTDYTTTITIANVAPVLSAVNATSIVENSSTTLTATLTDPGVLDTFTLIIDWGDGTIESIDLGASATGVTALSYQHQYIDDNAADSYTITLSVVDNDGGADQKVVNVAVTNANPVVSVANGLAPVLVEGSSVGLITLTTFTDSGTLDPHTVTIDWGDGSPLDTGATLVEPAGATPGSIQGNHLFDDGPAIRVVTVTVSDDDGGVGVASFNVVVNNVRPTATFQRPDAGSPTQMTSVEFVNSFDPSTADTTQGLLYSYDWNNDGAFEVAFSSITAMTIPAQYLSTSPNHTIHGRITDKDGGFTDYYLQQPAFSSKLIEIEFDLGAQSSYTLVAAAQPAPNYSIEVIDLPEGIANLAAIGLSFDGIATISGVPFVGGLLTLRATASNLAGIEVIDLVIKIKRPVNSNNPHIISAATANPNPCITGTPVTFSVVATDADGDVLSYFWTFADGSNARGRVVTHTYTVPGTYDVFVSVSDGKNDGIFDHFNLVVAKGTDNTFDVQQAKLSFDFRKAEKSTLYITGYIPVPSGPIAGVIANVSITGTTYAQAFQFDNKGTAGDAMSLFSVKTIQTGTGTSRAKFVFSLKSTNGLDPLNPSLFQKIGILFPAKTERAGETVFVPLVVTIGAQPTVTNAVPLTYKVVPNRSGKGQFKRK